MHVSSNVVVPKFIIKHVYLSTRKGIKRVPQSCWTDLVGHYLINWDDVTLKKHQMNCIQKVKEKGIYPRTPLLVNYSLKTIHNNNSIMRELC